MQLRTGVLGLLALVFSVSAAMGVYLFTRQPAGKPKVETVSIVVAAAPVQRGITLSAELLTKREWPKDFVPEGAMRNLEDAVGRTVWIPLVANDAVVEARLATKGSGRGMASLIPPGMRAVTIQTPNVATGVAGFVLPGNKVDVLWTVSQVAQDDQTGGGSTATLLQNIEILAVDQTLEMPNENMVDPRDLRSVTLLVSPMDAAKLDLAQNRGTLRLSLRNPEDTLTDIIATTTLSNMRQSSGVPQVTPEPRFDADALTSQYPEPEAELTQAAPAAPARAPDVLLPIRTLRGTSSGAVQLRRQAKPTAYLDDRSQHTASRS